MGDARPRRSLSGLAVAAGACSIVTLLLLAAEYVFHFGWAERVLFQSGVWSGALLFAPGILGIAAGVRLALSRGRLRGWWFCLLGIITAALGYVMPTAYALSMLAWATS